MINIIVTSSVLILIIITLRFLLRGKISLRLQYALWVLVALRLLVPFSLSAGSISVMNIVPDLNDNTAIANRQGMEPVNTETVNTPEKMQNTIGTNQGISDNKNDIIGGGTDNNPLTPTSTPSVWEIAYIIWIAGMGICGLCFLLSNVIFHIRLKKRAERVEMVGCPLPVYWATGLPSPCLFGLIRPTIYLTPESFESENRLNYILSHELTHRRHFDHIWSLIRGVCIIIYWFNPLVWCAAVLSKRDCELACDEGVLTNLDEDNRVEYGKTLISMMTAKNSPTSLLCAATTMTGGKRNIRERITLIANKPKMLATTLIIVLITVTVAVGCTFTEAKPDADIPDTDNPNDVVTATPQVIEQVDIDASELEAAVQNEIINYMSTGWWTAEQLQDADYEAAAFTELYREVIDNTVSLYGISMYRGYSLKESDVTVERDFGIECVITLDSGTLELIEFWIPGDGAYHDMDIAAKFPKEIADKLMIDYEMLNRHRSQLREECDKRAEAHFNIVFTPAAWSDEEIEHWASEVSMENITVPIDTNYSVDDIGYMWAEAYIKQYVENTSDDHPLHSKNVALLSSEIYAESIDNSPKTIAYRIRFVCEASDVKSFERWFVGWSAPLDDSDYPQYEGWMEVRQAFVLTNHLRDGNWHGARTWEEYNGWGYLNYDGIWNIPYYMEALTSDIDSIAPENVLQILPFIDWVEFNREYADSWNIIWNIMNDHCLTEGQVYGPEEWRMWSDVYPQDQTYRNLYVMLTALNTDGAYSEGISTILAKQKNYNPDVFDECLEHLTIEQRDRINSHVEYATY